MLFTEHFKTFHHLTHRHRSTIGIHAVKLVEHLLLIHRVFILHLKAVGHQQVTVGGIELVYQITRRLSSILNHGGALRLSFHTHRVIDINADQTLSSIDIQLLFGTIRESEGQHQCCYEKATQQQRHQVFQFPCLSVFLLNASKHSRVAEIHQLMPPEIEQVDNDGYQ